MAETARHLAPGGTIVGANWLRTPEIIRVKGYDTTFLSTEFVAGALAEHGLAACKTSVVPIQGEDWYESLIVWAGQRPRRGGRPVPENFRLCGRTEH